MSDCRKFEERWAAGPGGDPDGESEARMKKHLDECAECRRSLAETRRIMAGAEAVREDIHKVMATVDWEALPRRIAAAAFAHERRAPKASRFAAFWKGLAQPRWRPVYAGLLAGIVVGAAGMLLVLKPQLIRTETGGKYFASSELIDRAELQLARRETLDFLDKSQYLILDFVQSPPGRAKLFRADMAQQRTQDMLAKKRFLNQQLDKGEMAKAREICDQIEILFVELSQISDELSAEEAAKIKEFVEQKQLLLKIKLLRKELKGSEV